jgi:hypothetical protein
MPRIKRNKPHNPAKVHDRRARDLLRNAEVAAVEIDDPLGLEPGDKIVTLRSIRNDPLGRMHAHRHIDEAQYQGGRAFQGDWEKAERGPQAVDPSREYVDGVQHREPITEGQRKAVLRLRAGPCRAGPWADHGADLPAARSARPALDRLSRQAAQGMPGQAGVDLRVCDGAKIGARTAQLARLTKLVLSSFTERAPHCCMAARVSVRTISSTRSTPSWPNAPSPHR